jgi:hypothetical protein
MRATPVLGVCGCVLTAVEIVDRNSYISVAVMGRQGKRERECHRLRGQCDEAGVALSHVGVEDDPRWCNS